MLNPAACRPRPGFNDFSKMEVRIRFKIFSTAVLFLIFGRLAQAQTPVTPVTPVTFDNEVVRIFQQHCQNCHRPGQIAPFSLLTYAESRPHAIEIQHAVSSRVMPPWKPVNSHGVFEGERYLSDQEIQTISKWVDGGVLEGNPADLPAPLSFPETWSSGAPDLAVQPAEPFTVSSDQDDIYRCFTIPLSGQSDLNVTGYEVLPGNSRIVHHVLLFTDSSGESQKLDDDDPGPGYNCFGGAGFFNGLGVLGGWAPGTSAQMYPAGSGVKVPAGSRLVIQVHYSTLGHIVQGEALAPDLTRVGLHLSSTALQPISFLPLGNTTFAIPPGQSNYRVMGIWPILSPVELVSIAPHMHLLGRKILVEAWLPFFQRRQLIRIDDWEFHWQAIYNYKQPIVLPAGTLVVMTAYFDNSTNNPNNPSNPPVTVRFGEQTKDEMAFAFLMVKPVGTAGKDSTGGKDK